MNKPRLLPLAFAGAAILLQPQTVNGLKGEMTEEQLRIYQHRQRMWSYLDDVTRAVRGRIQRSCSAIESSYQAEIDRPSFGDDDFVEVARGVYIPDEERRVCAQRIAQTMDRSLGPRRNIYIGLECGAPDWGEDPEKCNVVASFPRHHFNSRHRGCP